MCTCIGIITHIHIHIYKECTITLPGRKSNCVREVEKLKKNREERRARQAVQMAQQNEVYIV